MAAFDDGQVSVDSILQGLGNALGGVIRRVGERLPNVLLGPEPQPQTNFLNPATWGIGTYLLIGGAVYFLMRKGRRRRALR